MAGSNFLRSLGLVEGLEPARRERVAAACVDRRYAPGHVIFREYSLGNERCSVKSGVLRVHISTGAPTAAPPGPSAALRTIAHVMPSQFVGELGMVDDPVRSPTVVAGETSASALMRDELGCTQGQAAPADSGFGVDALTDLEA